MKKINILTMFLCALISRELGAGISKSSFPASHAVTFTENKGQVSDQYNFPRKDVLYSGSVNGTIFHLKTTGVSYQFEHVNSWKEEFDQKAGKRKVAENIIIYRLDLNWVNSDENFKIVT